MSKLKVAILGAGSWGSAVAIHLAKSGSNVYLWGRNIDDLTHNLSNERYLPGIKFPEHLIPTNDLDFCLQNANFIIIALPSHAFAAIIEQIAKTNNNLSGLAWITKGIDPATNRLLSDLVKDKWGQNFPTAIISGPSFAKEVAIGLPTALVIASIDLKYQKALRNLFHHKNIRVYTSEDIIGIQLCGAVKNVLAIACGISDGLKYGANARAALITRGLSEMSRLGIALGAKPETFIGLAGVGDLVLTCTDNQSRNRRFGLLIGDGFNITDAKAKIGQVVEGQGNARQVCELANKYNVEMPICHAVDQLLNNELTAIEAVQKLLSRPPTKEG